MRVVIIGAGECGVRAAFSLRERGFEGQVTLFGAETSLPYERPPLSKDVTATPKAIRNLDAYLSAGIDLCLGQTVERILPGARQIIAGGQAHSYDRLLIATGARARQVPTFADCLTLRTDHDAAKIMASLAAGAKVGIIGAGFIGLELAATARRLGADVTVFQDGPQVLARAVPAQIGELVAARHRAEGVALRLDADVVAADRTSVSLAGGARFAFDTVIAGIGSAPNVELAAEAGLDVANGIVVDGNFRSSAPDVFAAGDCCSFSFQGRRIRLESWKAAQDQGDHAAAAMLGNGATYAKLPWFWSDQYDLTLQVAGLFDPLRAIHSRPAGEDGRIVFQIDDQGQLAAAAGAGPRHDIAKDMKILEKLIEKGAAFEPALISDPSTQLKGLLKAA
jgi:3-phenylpropionate/trans-cinnamate dioxygenase ferredoxin reductase subunit